MGNGFSSDRLRFLPRLPSFRALHIVILGLDCAGKTTVLYRLRFDEFVNTVPTKGFNSEKIKLSLGGGGGGGGGGGAGGGGGGGGGGGRGGGGAGGQRRRRWATPSASFHFWDVGGQEKLRPLWRAYTRCADGLVFVVDSVDGERMEEAKAELHKITRLAENHGVPVLVVANKQDLRHALGLAEVERLLALRELGAATPWHLQPACAIIGEGLREGVEKLHAMIAKRRKALRQQKKKTR
ncbi:unnamed protein product [Lota lota]